MSDRVEISMIGDGIADVRLNRADKMNALDQAMFQGLIEAARKLASDPKVRVAVLSGNGRAFCAGLDMASFAAMAGDGERKKADNGEDRARDILQKTDSPANFAQLAGWAWRELPVPVIAAIHGVAYGGGLQVALGADMRVVAPDARMSVMEIKWGLIPDMSGTQTLRHLVRGRRRPRAHLQRPHRERRRGGRARTRDAQQRDPSRHRARHGGRDRDEVAERHPAPARSC